MSRKINCPICLDQGVVLYKKKIGDYIYEFAAHCTCSNGNKYRYDGQSCDKRKSEYYMPSIAEEFDVKELAKENLSLFIDKYGTEKTRKMFSLIEK
ncbi:hypothetical protein SAMN02745883_00716 [Caminicella sporogenes DSM 14501]|uniref:Uncharacterized protein n=1 Tax=Caminicella sporogenes DSM 14501 TaxID=1121266 RepID=A0A1M6MZ44_9FIRM|nr:hypothetical protein [Caminicella sporogenes]RKD22432.1 hypothetical protein BET04_05210 [Caminicella sporogenes]SHJ88725.1 hypothetical protein SAMN02745883_00716 [Caminicella sporogenes DSM 14501]